MGPGPANAALSEFVLKVHARCDLACDHCYVYEHQDQSWRGRPRQMELDTVRAAAGRIAEHAVTHGLPAVTVILHGGEPLLLGPVRMRETLTELRRIIAPVTRLHLGMQTNGVLLSERFCDVLLPFGVRIGVSLDGDRAANDLHRRFAGGASSYEKVLRALSLVRRPEYRELYSGLLCTVDIAADPIRAYEALLAQEPPRVDFLLPHSTWDNPPVRPAGDDAPYARWLTTVYDRWLADGRPMRVRLFESLMSTGAGGPSASEWVGLDPVNLAVIETDGQWEQADSLKTAYPGAPATGLTVFAHGADEVAATPQLARRRLGLAGLSRTCQACPVVGQCGGGLFAHRYRSGSGFDNPSVFCADLKGLTRHMNDHPAPPAAPERLELDTDLLTLEQFDRVASATGDAEAVRLLAESQVSITKALLVAVADDLAPGGPAAEGWALLSDLDRADPAVVHDVLSHPYLRTWAVDCLSHTPAGRRTGHDHLAAIAAVAAVRAGVSADLRVPVRDGRVHLPALGTVALPAADGDTAVLRAADGRFSVSAGGTTVTVEPGSATGDAAWQPVRRLTADGVQALLEDSDPYRDCHDWKASERLDDDAAGVWARAFSAAFRILDQEVPDRAAGLREGLRTVVPLWPAPDGANRASTARQAFGGVATTPSDPKSLAVILVHEFQHGKLNALLDVCDLIDGSSPALIQVGWRPDPRPVEGVLHGIYAHLAVADIWRVRAARGGDDHSEAVKLFHQYRDWTNAALDTLTRTDALTPAGRRLVQGVAGAMAGWPL